ncbi:MAG: PDZ domain-containing protein, partial [Candidatus Cloacimonetes bacterium]|nr:PDZ domain-containing protein [Candidatus Cloacimonadota bacterium]
MANQGYYRFPTVYNDSVVFTSENNLWIVSAKGGVARQLTSTEGIAFKARFSPDGKRLAFSSTEEGHSEIYVIPSEGGPCKRLTYYGSDSYVVSWARDGSCVLFASNYGQPFRGLFYIYKVSMDGRLPERLPVGAAEDISYAKKKGVIIGRHTFDPARWKRYRGGTAGKLWIDINETGNFKPFLDLDTNIGSPMWINNRIYFISDHEGIGNIYSVNFNGKDIKRHTNHSEFYARNASTDSKSIVYHCGSDLYIHNIKSNISKNIAIKYFSSRAQAKAKFDNPEKYLQGYDIHPNAEHIALNVRGKVFNMANWEGAVVQNGNSSDARYRFCSWLHDGKRIALVSDEGGEEHLEIHWATEEKKPIKLKSIDIGQIVDFAVSPKDDKAVFSNNRMELYLANFKDNEIIKLDESEHGEINNIAWSPDAKWTAYQYWTSETICCIKLANINSQKTYKITNPVLRDGVPIFDTKGKYLYFLSQRKFDPIYDTMQFELSFPKGVRPYLITLDKELKNPFKKVPDLETKEKEEKEDKKQKDKKKEIKVKIDLDNIANRIIPFPLEEGIYRQIASIKEKVLFSVFPVEGSLGMEWFSTELPAKGSIKMYDFDNQKTETIIEGISNFMVAQNGKKMLIRVSNKLRIVDADKKLEDKIKAMTEPGRESGWIDLSRIKVKVDLESEWRQMYREAWRLQREHFWNKDMSNIDWQKVYKRYFPLLDRIGTRGEFSDLIWEMQGELGTSHSYEFGGDYKIPPQYKIGLLGADFIYDIKKRKYRIEHIVQGDSWDEDKDSPFNQPGLMVNEGDYLLGINGEKLDKNNSPYKLLLNQAGNEVFLRVQDGKTGKIKSFYVKTLKNEMPIRYREWVENNRKFIHEKTNGRIGYVHIPDMGPLGFSEFHRYYLSEFNHDGLIVDVRYNGGGHVSCLLLEKLARKRIGYDVPRWGKPEPYPAESVPGPIIALTNENAGSDGDIFSHSFKLMNLGPLIGKRTWGGVIGISARYSLMDGGLTTQPEYSFWFKDVGWGVENYGTDPDIEVDITPKDYVENKDPQLARAIQEVEKL